MVLCETRCHRTSESCLLLCSHCFSFILHLLPLRVLLSLSSSQVTPPSSVTWKSPTPLQASANTHPTVVQPSVNLLAFEFLPAHSHN